MKLLEGMVVRPLAGGFVAVPTGKAQEQFSGVIRLNETGKFIFDCIGEGLDRERIAEKMVETYEDVTVEQVLSDIEEILTPLIENGIVQEEV